MMIAPFEHGPDRTLLLAADNRAPVTLDGYVLMIDDRYSRVLAAFDAPEFSVAHWLPFKYASWIVFSPDDREAPTPDYGLAKFMLPQWLVDNLDKLSTRALLERRREEEALRQAEKEAEQKRQQRAQRRPMGLAAGAAKAKAQSDLFDPDIT